MTTLLKITLTLLVLIWFFSIEIFSQINLNTVTPNVEDTNSAPISNRGLFITSKGTIKALAVFIQFLGDNSHPDSKEWPFNQPPVFLHTFLDSTEAQVSVPWSFSDYYRKMSFDALKIYGKGYFVITRHTEKYYRDTLHLGNEAFGRATKEVLGTLTSRINYAEYDNWKDIINAHTPNTPDGVVDLIIVLYRQSIYPSGNKAQGIAKLGTNESNITLNGKILKFGIPGSGITNSGGWQGMAGFMPSMKHEYGHLLLGGGHPEYSNRDDGGLASAGMSGILMGQGNVATGWERQKLGWINYINVLNNQPATLGDYAITGQVLKIAVPGTKEAFLIQNHQKLCIYDDPNTNRPGKGIFIYHIKDTTASQPNYDMEVAEGKFNWVSPYWFDPGPGWGINPLPAFSQTIANPAGYDGRDMLPTDRQLSNGKWICEAFYYYENGRPVHVDRYKGDPKDAYNIGYNQVFSPWSNPNSNTWNNSQTSIAVEITGKHSGSNGEDVFDLNLFVNTPEQVSPSKPINLRGSYTRNNSISLSWTRNTEPHMIYTGNHHYDIYRSIFYDGCRLSYIKINSTPITSPSFSDNPPPIPIGIPADKEIYWSYHIKAIDNTGKVSVVSEDARVRVFINYLHQRQTATLSK